METLSNSKNVGRKQAEARRIARQSYAYQCCVVCGLQLPAALTVAHLDQQPENNDADNLAWLCGTHHWMFDCDLYPVDAIKLLREHWQKTQGNPSHAGRMKNAGARAALTRRLSARAKKAWTTRRTRPNLAGEEDQSPA